MEIKVGRAYRAKKPVISATGFVNDRQVAWISADGCLVQYDSPSIPNGRKYPTVSIAAFLKWASHDVTDKLPEGGWARGTL